MTPHPCREPDNASSALKRLAASKPSYKDGSRIDAEQLFEEHSGCRDLALRKLDL
jgi:hypothetical protein